MNPELMRMAWIEVSSQRLWLIPASLIGSAILLHQSDLPHTAISNFALWAFVVATMIWGAKQSSDSVRDELRDRTWEVQRMCALPPWTMTWGKLGGAALMPWYAGFICLGIHLSFAPEDNQVSVLARVSLFALVAILVHAFSLTVALVAAHLGRRVRARLNLLITLILLSLVLPGVSRLAAPQWHELTVLGQRIFWYGIEFDGTAFTLAMAAAFAAWAVVSAWRMMCIELEVRTWPLAWLCFVLFLTWLSCGYVYDPHGLGLLRQYSSAAAIIACALAYVAAFSSARDPVAVGRLLELLRRREFQRALESLPLWISATTVAIALAVIAATVGADGGSPNDRFDNLGLCALSYAFLLVRDVALLSGFSFRDPAGRADVSTLVWIAILNRLLPGLLAIGGLGLIANLIRPQIYDLPALAAIITLTQAVAATGFAAYYYRRAMRVQPTR